MTKTELYTSVAEVLAKFNVKQAAQDEILALLEVKKGGVKANPEEFTVFNADGVATHVLCPVTNLWFPCTEDNFYFTDGVLRGRVSKFGEKLKKDFVKAVKASKEAILNDVINGVITPEAGKEQVAQLDASTIVVPAEVAELGSAVRPA